MKKIYCLIFIFILLAFTSCTTEEYLNQVPTSDIGYIWISEDPDVYFFAYSEYCYGYGCITVNGTTVEIQAEIDYGYHIDLCCYRENEMNATGDYLYSGKWEREGDILTVKTTEDNIFGGKYETITFTRYLKSDYPELED